MSYPSIQSIAGYGMIVLLIQLFLSSVFVFQIENHLLGIKPTGPGHRLKWFLRMMALPAAILVIVLLALPSAKLVALTGSHGHGSRYGNSSAVGSGNDGLPGPESNGSQGIQPIQDLLDSVTPQPDSAIPIPIKSPATPKGLKDTGAKPNNVPEKPLEKAVSTPTEAEKLKAVEAEKPKAAEAEKMKAAEAEKAKAVEAEKLKAAEAEKVRGSVDAKKEVAKAGEAPRTDPLDKPALREKPKVAGGGGDRTAPNLESINLKKDPAKELDPPKLDKHSFDVSPDKSPLDEQTRHALVGVPGTPRAREVKNPNPKLIAVKSKLAKGSIPPMAHTGNTAALSKKYPRAECAWVYDRAEDVPGSGEPATLAKWVYEPKHDEVYSSADSMFHALTGSYQLEEMIPTATPQELAIWHHRDQILRESGIPISLGDRIRWGWFRHKSEAMLLGPVVGAWNRAIQNNEIKPDPDMDNVLEVVWAERPDGTPFVDSVRFLPGGKRNSPQARVLTMAN